MSLGRIMSAALAGLILSLAGGGGCSGGPRPADASSPDAAPPPCLHWPEPYWVPPDNLLACGACVGDHEVVIGTNYPEVVLSVAVPDGLLIIAPVFGVYPVLVLRDGRTMRAADPITEVDPTHPIMSLAAAAVPGTSRVWLTGGTAVPGGLGGTSRWYTSAVLLDASEAGISVVAAGSLPGGFLASAVAPDGSAFGAMIRSYSAGDLQAFARVRPRLDGTLETLTRETPLGGMLDPRLVHTAWLAGSGDIFVESNRTFPGPTYVVRLNADLEDVGLPFDVSLDAHDPAFADPTDPNRIAPVAADSVVMRDGSIAILSGGQLPGRPEIAMYGQYWVNWLQPDGTLAMPPPGTLLNPTGFPTTADYPDGYALSRNTYHEMMGGRLAFEWWFYPPTNTRRAQIVSEAGELTFSAPLDLNYIGDPRPQDIPSTMDGNGAGYAFESLRISAERTNPLDPFPDELTIERIGESLDFTWPSAFHPQQCQMRAGEAAWTVTGDLIDGVWFVWQELYPSANGHEEYWLLKATLVDSSGSFAW